MTSVGAKTLYFDLLQSKKVKKPSFKDDGKLCSLRKVILKSTAKTSRRT